MFIYVRVCFTHFKSGTYQFRNGRFSACARQIFRFSACSTADARYLVQIFVVSPSSHFFFNHNLNHFLCYTISGLRTQNPFADNEYCVLSTTVDKNQFARKKKLCAKTETKRITSLRGEAIEVSKRKRYQTLYQSMFASLPLTKLPHECFYHSRSGWCVSVSVVMKPSNGIPTLDFVSTFFARTFYISSILPLNILQFCYLFSLPTNSQIVHH